MYVLQMLFDIAMKKYFPKMYPSGQIWDKNVKKVLKTDIFCNVADERSHPRDSKKILTPRFKIRKLP